MDVAPTASAFLRCAPKSLRTAAFVFVSLPPENQPPRGVNVLEPVTSKSVAQRLAPLYRTLRTRMRLTRSCFTTSGPTARSNLAEGSQSCR